MSTVLHQQIYQNMNLRETDDLLAIWQRNDREEWSDEAMQIVKDILTERGVEIPEQTGATAENEEKDALDDGLDEWEIRLLETENQPDFYDTIEVIDLKKKINLTARAVVVVHVLESIVFFKWYVSVIQLYFPNFKQYAPSIYLISLIVAVLSAAITIAIAYYPLKALSNILRILMEMEFRSRKAL
jgi:hypothetical protein